ALRRLCLAYRAAMASRLLAGKVPGDSVRERFSVRLAGCNCLDVPLGERTESLLARRLDKLRSRSQFLGQDVISGRPVAVGIANAERVDQDSALTLSHGTQNGAHSGHLGRPVVRP